MTFFPLTTEDKSRLRRLNEDKVTVFALKKLFMNVCADELFAATIRESTVEVLAAERIALEYIKQAFQDLSMIKLDDNTGAKKEENLV